MVQRGPHLVRSLPPPGIYARFCPYGPRIRQPDGTSSAAQSGGDCPAQQSPSSSRLQSAHAPAASLQLGILRRHQASLAVVRHRVPVHASVVDVCTILSARAAHPPTRRHILRDTKQRRLPRPAIAVIQPPAILPCACSVTSARHTWTTQSKPRRRTPPRTSPRLGRRCIHDSVRTGRASANPTAHPLRRKAAAIDPPSNRRHPAACNPPMRPRRHFSSAYLDDTQQAPPSYSTAYQSTPRSSRAVSPR